MPSFVHVVDVFVALVLFILVCDFILLYLFHDHDSKE